MEAIDAALKQSIISESMPAQKKSIRLKLSR